MKLLRTLVVCGVTSVAGATSVRAQVAGDFLPSDAPNCAVSSPPATAGIAATPGGFLMVFPRNEAIGKRYTGCKSLWVVDSDSFRRLATLYFSDGSLTIGVAHDSRDPTGAIEGVCSFPAGKSLAPTIGRKFGDAACRGGLDESLYGLQLATWPRRCLTDPKAAVCQEDPR